MRILYWVLLSTSGWCLVGEGRECWYDCSIDNDICLGWACWFLFRERYYYDGSKQLLNYLSKFQQKYSPSLFPQLRADLWDAVKGNCRSVLLCSVPRFTKSHSRSGPTLLWEYAQDGQRWDILSWRPIWEMILSIRWECQYYTVEHWYIDVVILQYTVGLIQNRHCCTLEHVLFICDEHQVPCPMTCVRPQRWRGARTATAWSFCGIL
jgi:hypothetical protein